MDLLFFLIGYFLRFVDCRICLLVLTICETIRKRKCVCYIYINCASYCYIIFVPGHGIVSESDIPAFWNFHRKDAHDCVLGIAFSMTDPNLIFSGTNHGSIAVHSLERLMSEPFLPVPESSIDSKSEQYVPFSKFPDFEGLTSISVSCDGKYLLSCENFFQVFYFSLDFSLSCLRILCVLLFISLKFLTCIRVVSFFCSITLDTNFLYFVLDEVNRELPELRPSLN